jgi:hypothetical protein
VKIATRGRRGGWRVEAGRRAVVVGGGMTGLAAGALLARRGLEVTLLEAHPTALGGHARRVEVEGHRFCAGPRYTWGFREGGAGRQVLELLDLDVPFIDYGPEGFDRVALGDQVPVDIPTGLRCCRDLIGELRPADRRAARLFFSYVSSVSDACAEVAHRSRGRAGRGQILRTILLSTRLGPVARIRAFQSRSWSLADLFALSGVSPEARRLLYAWGAIFAIPPTRLPVAFYCGAMGAYHAGALAPAQGFGHLVEALAGAIRDRGGAVRLGARAVRLEVSGQRVVAVHCADGTQHPCDLVLSNLSPRRTAALTPERRGPRQRYRPSNSLCTCYLGTTHPGVPGRVGARNLWWVPLGRDPDFDGPDMTAPPGMMYLGRAGAANGVHPLVVFVPGNYAQAAAAAAEGPARHAALQKDIGHRVVECIDRHLLRGFRETVRFVQVDTPWDTAQATGAEDGAAYGRYLDRNGLASPPRDHLGLDNLRIACATTGFPGVAPAFRAALALAGE